MPADAFRIPRREAPRARRCGAVAAGRAVPDRNPAARTGKRRSAVDGAPGSREQDAIRTGV